MFIENLSKCCSQQYIWQPKRNNGSVLSHMKLQTTFLIHIYRFKNRRLLTGDLLLSLMFLIHIKGIKAPFCLGFPEMCDIRICNIMELPLFHRYVFCSTATKLIQITIKFNSKQQFIKLIMVVQYEE